MAQRKKIIALSVLKGISIFGILIGLSLVYFTVVVILPTLLEDNFAPENHLALRCGEFIFSGVVLIVGAYLVYTSCLMFRGRTFEAFKTFSVFVALSLFISVVDPLCRLPIEWVNGEEARALVGLASFFVALFLSVFVYLICVKLLKRLVEVAYGSEHISGTQNSKPEDEKLSHGTTTY